MPTNYSTYQQKFFIKLKKKKIEKVKNNNIRIKYK